MTISWSTVRKAAQRVEPAARWRENLSRALQRASGASFVAVYTCPPGEMLDGQHSVYPENKNQVMERIRQEVLPSIAWTRHGERNRFAQMGRAYFPLDFEAPGTLKRLLAPVVGGLDIEQMMHASFLAEGAVVGGAVLWFVSAEGTEALLEPVTDVALVAGRTLEAAIGMARGCGVDVDVDPVLPLEQLSSRELQVARLAAAGLTDVNIAESLVISEQTVGAHMRRIFLKLRINSRLQLVQDTRLRRSLAS